MEPTLSNYSVLSNTSANATNATSKTPNRVITYMITRKNWGLLDIFKRKDRKKIALGKAPLGFDSAGTPRRSLATKIEYCTDVATVMAAVTASRIPAYFVQLEEPLILIDLDDVDWATVHQYTIPFPCRQTYVEISPSGTGLHIYCGVTKAVKEAYVASLEGKYNTKNTDLECCKSEEIFTHNHYLSFTGNEFLDCKIKTLPEAIVEQCKTCSTKFADLYTGATVSADQSADVAYLSTIIYRVTGLQPTQLNVACVYDPILRGSSVVNSDPKWSISETGASSSKLDRWLYKDLSLNSMVASANKIDEEELTTVLEELAAAPITSEILQSVQVTSASLPVPPQTGKGSVREELAAYFHICNPNIVWSPRESVWYFYESKTHVYVELADDALKLKVYDLYCTTYPSESHNFIENVVRDAVIYKKRLGYDIKSICSREDHVQLQDCILNLRTGALLECTPKFFSLSAVPITKEQYIHAHTCNGSSYTKWEEFLTTTFNEDEQTIEAFQRFCGYLISSSYAEQKALCLIGESGSGKSTATKVIAHVLGVPLSTVGIAQLNGNFGTSIIRNTPLVVIPELPENTFKLGAVWEILKAIISGDPVIVEAKGKQAYSDMLKTKVILCTNHEFTYKGDVESLNRRFIYCRTPKSFSSPDLCNLHLEEELKDEASIIFKWMYEGYKLWRESGLIQTESGREIAESMRESSSDTIQDFIENVLEGGTQSDSLPIKELYNAYTTFCDLNSIHYRVSKRRLVKVVKTYFARLVFKCSVTELEGRTGMSRLLKHIKIKTDAITVM